jgi:hypothetical protein
MSAYVLSPTAIWRRVVEVLVKRIISVRQLYFDDLKRYFPYHPRDTFLGVSTGLLGLIVWTAALPNSSSFEREILSKAELGQPASPFVTIFFHGGNDTSDFGFTVDGNISEMDWQVIFRHVGYIAPYAPIKPDGPDRWNTYHYDVAVRAAQDVGRYSGASIMGMPTSPSARANLLEAYKNPLCLRMTHFFQDDESDIGIPGGDGLSRLKISRSVKEAIISTSSVTHDAIPIPAEFQLTLGVSVGNYVFGGDLTLLTLYGATDGKPVWTLRFHNAEGYFGVNYFEAITPTGALLQSVPLTYSQAARWHILRLTAKKEPKSEVSSIGLEVKGFGVTSLHVPRISPTNAGLRIGDERGYKSDIDLDDIVLRNATEQELAAYNFEVPSERAIYVKELPNVIHDVSGNGHDLQSSDQFRTVAHLWPTTGIDPTLATAEKTWLVDNLLDARRKAHIADPILLTNWRLSDQPGRFRYWSTYGFDHGSTEYYLAGDPDPVESNLVRVFHKGTERTQWAWNDGSNWTHAWIGNETSSVNVLSPQDYLSLVTLAVLDGNRWFSVFTAMSHGHLGLSSATRREGAIANADSLYNMALAASWFQSTSDKISDSVYLGEQPLRSNRDSVIFRSRINPVSREMWFAVAPKTTQGPAFSVSIALSAPDGTLTNLATHCRQRVSGGMVQIPVQQIAQPYYYQPAGNAS